MNRLEVGVSGQAGGSGAGTAVEVKTAPMEYAEVTRLGSVVPEYVAVGRRLRDKPPPARGRASWR